MSFFAASYDIHGEQRQRVIGDVLDLTDLAYKAEAEVNSLDHAGCHSGAVGGPRVAP